MAAFGRRFREQRVHDRLPAHPDTGSPGGRLPDTLASGKRPRVFHRPVGRHLRQKNRACPRARRGERPQWRLIRTRARHSAGGRADDPREIRRIVESSGYFSREEIEIAVELIDERIARGDASGYHFLFADSPTGMLGYTCFGPIPATESSYDLYWIAIDEDLRGRGLGATAGADGRVRRIPWGGATYYIEPLAGTGRLHAGILYTCGYRRSVSERFVLAGDGKLITCRELSGGRAYDTPDISGGRCSPRWPFHDSPFRRIARRHGAALVIRVISAEGFSRGNRKTLISCAFTRRCARSRSSSRKGSARNGRGRAALEQLGPRSHR